MIDVNKLRYFAEICQKSYRCNVTAGEFDADAITARMIHVGNTQAYFIETNTALIVAVRGTEWHEFGDLVANLNVLPTRDYSIGWVKRGYVNEANRIMFELKRLNFPKRVLETKKPVYVVGHSLGGAVAYILAARLREYGYAADPFCVSFGAPAVILFSNIARQPQHVRVAAAIDIVPRISKFYTHKHTTFVMLAEDEILVNPTWIQQLQAVFTRRLQRHPFNVFKDHYTQAYVAALTRLSSLTR